MERKEKGGGKRGKKKGKYVFGMKKKMEGREKWRKNLWVGPLCLILSKVDGKGREERNERMILDPV